MSTNQAIAIGAGVVAAGLVLVTAGAALGVYAGLAASIAFSAASLGATYLLGSPKQNSGNDAAAENLNIANAAAAYAVPVIFGTQRMAGNFLRYDEDTFKAEAIKEDVEDSGGKGGGGGSSQQITGYKYFLSFEYGLCMGPVDGVWQVLSDPGQKELLDNSDFIAFSDDDMDLDATNQGEDQGGTITIYRGSSTQGRGSDDYDNDGMKYRNLCWAMFQEYHMGPNPAPNSYLFELTRFPRCYDASGNIVGGIKTRGSANTGRLEYYDANPAAILYECLTDRVWGRGISPSLIDTQSFIDASVYFENQNLGMSFTLAEQQSLSDIVESIRLHVDTILVWNGEKIRCRVLMDTSKSFDETIVVDSNSVRDLEVTRPAWPDTTNEVRCEFVSRDDNYQAQNVIVQNIGAIETVGYIKSKKIGLNGFSTWDNADRTGRRILEDICFPAATCTFKIDRYGSVIECGDLIELRWSEWSDGVITSWWRVASVSDEQQDSAGITITAIEETDLTPQEGAPEQIVQTVPAWEQATPVAKNAVKLATPKGQAPLLDLNPSSVFELPPLLADGRNRLAFLCQRKTDAALAASLYWSLDGAADYSTIGTIPCWAITGTLVGTLGTEYRDLNRGSTGFVIQLNQDAYDAPVLLGSANKVLSDADHMDVLIAKPQDLLLIGNEIFQIGKSEALGGGQYRLTNYIRARYDTLQASHANGAAVAFVPLLASTQYIVEQGTIPSGQALDFRAYPIGIRGAGNQPADFVGPETGGVLIGRGERPEAPEFYDKVQNGTQSWDIRVRPRIPGIGGLTIEEELNRIVTDLDGLGFLYRHRSSSSGVWYSELTPATMTWTPDDGTQDGGLVLLTLPYISTIYDYYIWAVKDGLTSPTSLKVPL